MSVSRPHTASTRGTNGASPLLPLEASVLVGRGVTPTPSVTLPPTRAVTVWLTIAGCTVESVASATPGNPAKSRRPSAIEPIALECRQDAIGNSASTGCVADDGRPGRTSLACDY